MDFSEPTQPSGASRFPALKSRSTCRGFAVYQNRAVVFESHLELMVLFMLTLLPDVATIIEQPKEITYWDGVVSHGHTFDFLVIFRDGRRLLIAVKPAARVVRSGIQRTLRLIAEQLPPGIADSIHLITDEDFTYADRYNAAMAFDYLRFPVAEHDQAVTRLSAEVTGSIRIADLVKASGLGAMGFRSIVRLIISGVFVQVKPGERITYDTYVRSAAQSNVVVNN